MDIAYLMEHAYLVDSMDFAGSIADHTSDSTSPAGTPRVERPWILEMLPTELLADIFGFLHYDSAVIHAVRRVCRRFQDAAWPAFGHTFNHKVFHLTKGSLSYLVQLASDDRMAPYVKQLHISTISIVRPCLSNMLDWIHRDCDERERQRRAKVYKACSSTATADVEFGDRGMVQTQFQRALMGFKKLETIFIVDGGEL